MVYKHPVAGCGFLLAMLYTHPVAGCGFLLAMLYTHPIAGCGFLLAMLYSIVLYYISLGPQPVGVQCPLTSSLGEFHGYWDWLGCPGLPPVLVSIAFSPYLSFFSIHSSPA